MKYLFICTVFSILFLGKAHGQQSFSKVDTVLKSGKVGYRVQCKNKNVDQNELTIKPVGFESGGGARDVTFMIRGRIGKSEIDDLNGDGYPDLVLFVYSDSIAEYGAVYAFLSEANKSIIPCVLPDVMMDGKVSAGYKGHDQFAIMQTYLQQKFPIYKPGDDKDKPTGGTRVLLYQLVKGADGGDFKFNRVRFYDQP